MFGYLTAIVAAVAIAACAPATSSDEDLDAVREREAARISSEIAAAASEPVVPRNEVDARALAIQDAREEMIDRHTKEQRELQAREDDLHQDAEDECMQPLVDNGIDSGLLPEGTRWHEFSGDVFPGVGGELGLELTQDEIDRLAERANGRCLHAGDDVYAELEEKLLDRQEREVRALEDEEQEMWDQQLEDGTYQP